MNIIPAGKWLVFAVSAAALAVAAGCSRASDTPPATAHEEGHEEGEREEAGHDEGAEARAVRFNDAQLKEFNIEVATAGPGKLHVEVSLPGEIAPHADRLAHIVPRFVGVVKEVRKQVGDAVSKDEVLAVIESNESLSPYEVRALNSGTIIERHLVVGELIEEGITAFVVADLSEVWAELRVYQKDLNIVRKGQRALIAAGHGVAEAEGDISYVSPMVDETTRTGLARVVLPNPDGRWRPGLFVTANVTVDEIDVPMMIPKTALQTVDEKSCVFVQTDEGFAPRPVALGRANDSHVEVASGMAAGERYAAQGAFTLKAELSKAAFGDGHGH